MESFVTTLIWTVKEEKKKVFDLKNILCFHSFSIFSSRLIIICLWEKHRDTDTCTFSFMACCLHHSPDKGQEIKAHVTKSASVSIWYLYLKLLYLAYMSISWQRFDKKTLIPNWLLNSLLITCLIYCLSIFYIRFRNLITDLKN